MGKKKNYFAYDTYMDKNQARMPEYKTLVEKVFPPHGIPVMESPKSGPGKTSRVFPKTKNRGQK